MISVFVRSLFNYYTQETYSEMSGTSGADAEDLQVDVNLREQVERELEERAEADNAVAEAIEAIASKPRIIRTSARTDRISPIEAKAVMKRILKKVTTVDGSKVRSTHERLIEEDLIRQLCYLGGSTLAAPKSTVYPDCFVFRVLDNATAHVYLLSLGDFNEELGPSLTRKQFLLGFSKLIFSWLSDTEFQNDSRWYTILTEDDVRNAALKEKIRASRSENLALTDERARQELSMQVVRNSLGKSSRTQD